MDQVLNQIAIIPATCVTMFCYIYSQIFLLLPVDETPGVSVKWANMWLGGGRDLHREELRKRPKSAHLPGYKETDETSREAYSRPHTTGSPIKPSYVHAHNYSYYSRYGNQ